MFARSGPACRISFSTERSTSKVIWSQSKRLVAGTLVALSPRSDAFKTKCFVAIVAARYLNGGLEPDPQAGEGENTPPRIEIFWGNHEDAILDPSIELMMIEATGGYYEPIRHALVGLQHAALYESKFDKYIVEECRTIQDANNAQLPPTSSEFDHSQREAFDCMTSRELAIVQGPPGTGKTYTSIVAIQSYVQTLRANKGKDEPPTPIVVSAQTNHALDQLLGRCIQTGAKVARLGGQSQVPVINERTLHNLEQHSKVKPGSRQGEKDRKRILGELKSDLSLCFPGGFITADYLYTKKLLTQDQFESLRDNEWETEAQPSVKADNPDDEGSLDIPDESFVGLISEWLKDCYEKDQTYVYRPPRGQKEAFQAGLENPQEYLPPDPEDDKRQRLNGEFVSTEFYYNGSLPGLTSSNSAWYYQGCNYLRRYSDLYQIPPPQRGMVYRCLRQKLIDEISKELPKRLKLYQQACDRVKITQWVRKVQVLHDEETEVLGCTTTGLTKYRGLISAMKPQILMIEEAAETREASITSALYPSLDQVVLVGDHQQLVPHVDVHELERYPYRLNVSLFERLVRLNIPYSMLKVQRRMIPIIRSVVHTFYPELEDHESVKDANNRLPVPGMGGKNLWWFQHQLGDSFNAECSFYNSHEAEMIVGFVTYLVLNGVRPSQITVLTYYNGQVSAIVNLLRRNATLSNYNPAKEWSVRTVDGFQGEENEIIILSLVRSPQSPYHRPRAGFVENENRAVVATSRARCGMYIFGNSNNILTSSPESAETWQRVHNVLVEEGCIGYRLPVVCKMHNRITEIGRPSDWGPISGGGCKELCNMTCPEGHPCKQVCHPTDSIHARCREMCGKTLACDHKCGSLCGHPCECARGCNKPKLAGVQLPLMLPSSTTVRTQPDGHPNPQLPSSRQPSGPSSGNQSPRSQGGKGFEQGGGRGGKGPVRGGGAQGCKNRPRPRDRGSERAQQAPASLPIRELGPQRVTEAPARPCHNDPTSEDLIEMGYHAGIAETAGQLERIREHHRETKLTPYLDSTASVFKSAAQSEDSMSEKWSPRKIMQIDRASQLSLQEDDVSPTRGPTKIIQRFYATTADSASRQRPTITEHVFPAAQPRQRPATVGSEASTTTSEKFSRKQCALDMAAGLYNVDDVESLAPAFGIRDVRQPESIQEQDTRIDELDPPLILFD
ncbi:P-loop containing nucleoside triphosphate hydrolase protein [Dactylonectria estremocensis]|uniref:P-loop containing nucleoside triphosphate hydrolase protein n=1 Tax=Dactylonectria estremocensis TaxID=1079267 RepID=A0A9P9ECA0_9HYPO|nr:P-loop containing nucleoside triphosphate hydrolase protein [Dactylonectria estremocensis]